MADGTILNVDKDVARRTAVSESLKRQGLSVTETASASEATRLARSRATSLIIFNTHLSDMDAEEFCRLLKSESATKAIPLLQLSYAGYSESGGKAKYADAYLNRPAEIEIISAAKMLLRIREAEDTIRTINSSCEILSDSASRYEQKDPRETPDAIRLWISEDEPNNLLTRRWLEMARLALGEESDWAGGIHPDDFERYIQICSGATQTQAPFEIEYRHRQNDGQYRWLRDEAVPLAVSDGRIAYIGSCVDITDRKQVEAERDSLRKQEKAALEGSEAAWLAKDEFVNDLAPDLRGPLESILSWASLLKTTPVDQSTMQEAIETIEHSASTQSRLIKERLDAARLDRSCLQFERKPVELLEVIETALENIRPAAEARGIIVNLHPESRLETVTGDASRLQQVIWILLTNAVKYNRPGGRVEVLLESAGNRANIVISDTGQGIRGADLPSVFDRFHRTDGPPAPYRKSSGRELLLARTLVELQGGTISAYSAGQGLGAQFTVSIPLSDSPSTNISSPRAEGSETDPDGSDVSPSDESDLVSA